MHLEPLELRTLLAGYTLDTSFGHTGTVEVPISVSHEDSATAIALLSNGDSIVVGTTITNRGAHPQLFLARLNANGALDKSFGNNGIATTNFKSKGGGDWLGASASDVQIVSGGKILVAGSLNAQPAAFRFNANGSLDHSFYGDGVASFKVSNMKPADIT